MSFRRDPKVRPSLTHILRPVRYTMKYSQVNTLASLLPVLFAYVRAETHTVVLDNRCNFGTPVLIGSDGTLLSEGGNFTINGPSEPVLIAFLKTPQCGDMGEGCLIVETTLRNPVTPGIGSGTDLNLIFPHAFSANTSFEYFNGCDGVGQSCDNPACPDAFHSPDDERTVTVCLADDVNLAITFCQ